MSTSTVCPPDPRAGFGRFFRLVGLLVLVAIGSPAPAPAALEPSTNQRYLVDGNTGEPFFLTGDAAWSLIAELTIEDARSYLDDRASKGFNMLMVNLLEHEFATNPPANAYGDLPFTGDPFVTPNEAYFAHADQIIAEAAARDIVVLLAPVYLGYICGSQGWCQEVQAASLADMRAWGEYVGARYAGFDNIIWLIGGDTNPLPVADKLREVVTGIQAFDTIHLLTAHNQPETEAVTMWPGDDWIGVNSVYTYSETLYEECRDAFGSAGLPYFLLESAYENDFSTTPATLRAQSYWAATSGAFGHIFGNCPVWHFGTDDWCGLTNWQAEIDSPGSFNMKYYRLLFESRNWTELVPDFDNSVLTSGAGTFGSTDYATAAYATDGSSIIAYLPSRRNVTIDPSILNGSTIRAWWYDPADGSATDVGTFPKSSRTFHAPQGEDWVLVIDDEAQGFPPPGTPQIPVNVPGESIESALRVLHVRPNPSTDRVAIELRLPPSQSARLVIANAEGRLVRRFALPAQRLEIRQLEWDGRDEHGTLVPAGVYFINVATDDGMTLDTPTKLIRRR